MNWQARTTPTCGRHLSAVLSQEAVKSSSATPVMCPSVSFRGRWPGISIRSTATTYKLRVSGGDIKAVQGENGQKDPKMVTHQYSRIIDEDRIRIADAMNDDFYRKDERVSEEQELMSAVKDNPELFKQFMAFMSVANPAKKTGQ